MTPDTESDNHDAVTSVEDKAMERFRQAARRDAIVMGIPPSAADQVVRPVPGGVPVTSSDDSRGNYPGVMEILMRPGDSAIRDTDEQSLRRKTVPEQLHAIAKLDLYLQLEQALREIWPSIEYWLTSGDCLLGSIENITAHDPQGRMVRAQTLRPLSRERLDHIIAEQSFRRTCMYVSYYVRAVCRAHVWVWANRRGEAGDKRTVVPHFQISAGKQRLEEFIWSGVNTAVKLMINSLVLLYELYTTREGLSVIDRETWSRRANANRSFVSLFAAVGLTDFVTFDEMVEEDRDLESEEFQKENGLMSWTREDKNLRLYQPFYDARFFQLADDPKGVARLDLDPDEFEEELRRAFGKDIMVRRCPALRVGVVNQIYAWISRAVLGVAGSALG